MERGKAEGERRGREENAKGRGNGSKCVFTILATDYFSKKNFGPRPKGYLNLKKGYGGSIGGLEHYITLKISYISVKPIDR